MKQTYFENLLYRTAQIESKGGETIYVALDDPKFGFFTCTLSIWEKQFRQAQPLWFFKDGKEIQVGQTFEQLLEEIHEENELPEYLKPIDLSGLSIRKGA